MLTPCSFIFLLLLISSLQKNALSCNQIDRDSLLSFHRHVNSTPLLDWSSSANCCEWEGVSCATSNENRVVRLSLPGKNLTVDHYPIILANLSFLSHLNLSHNRLAGPLPLSTLSSLKNLRTLDLSFNRFSGFIQSSDGLPVSIQTIDLSSNQLNGPLDPSFFIRAANLIRLNVSNNSFTGPIPIASICSVSPLVEVLDFSTNQFSGGLSHGLGECTKLRIFRAGSNSLSGSLPRDVSNATMLREMSLPNNFFSGPIDESVVRLSELVVLELHVNELTGALPTNIGLLYNLEQLQLHTNSLSGALPRSLTNCSKITTLLLRNNRFTGEISVLDFSRLKRLQAVDLGNNSFVGNFPNSMCLCRSLAAVRLAYNRLTGEIPPCVASLRSLAHLSVSDNYLSNVLGALKILRHCESLAVLFMSRCFNNEKVPDDDRLLSLGDGFRNLQILTLGGCQLKGQIPSWIAKLKRLKVLNLSYNNISGPIPKWLGSMPSLFVLNLTQNYLSGQLPREIGYMPALIADNASTDLSSLALPFLFDARQYNRLFNLPRGIKVDHNRLIGNIPEEIGRLKLLHVLELSGNEFNGSIPTQLSRLVNLEKLDMSNNRLSGEIPTSLTKLNFLSVFSVANNHLEGEIPRGGQFDTFPADSFEGNPRLCGYLIKRSCDAEQETVSEDEESESSWYNVPFGLGYFVGLFAVIIAMLFNSF